MYQPRNNKVRFLFILSQLSYLLAFEDDATRIGNTEWPNDTTSNDRAHGQMAETTPKTALASHISAYNANTKRPRDPSPRVFVNLKVCTSRSIVRLTI